MARKAIIHPLREGYSGTATPEVEKAVSRVLHKWNGTDWGSVRATIEASDPGLRPSLDDWTEEKVRCWFAANWPHLVIKWGGANNTWDCNIVPVEIGVIKVPVGECGKKTSGGGRPPKYSDEEIEKFRGWWSAYEKTFEKEKARATHEGFLEWGEDNADADATFPAEVGDVVNLKRAVRHRNSKPKQTRRQK